MLGADSANGVATACLLVVEVAGATQALVWETAVKNIVADTVKNFMIW